MRKLHTTMLVVFLTVCLCLSVQAQRQSTVVQLLNNSSATGRVYPLPNDLIGAGAHKWLYCTTASSLQVVAEENPDPPTNVTNGHFVVVSPVYGVPSPTVNGNPCSEIQVGGLAAIPAFNVLSISGGTISVWYLGMTGAISTFPPATNSTGATTPVQCDATAISNSVTATQTRIITGQVGKKIYICGGTISLQSTPTGSGTIQLSTGTGTNCGTNNFPFYLVATAAASPLIFSIGSGQGLIYVVPPNTDLCLTGPASVTGGMTLALSYAQF